MFKKNLLELGDFWIAILILKMEENMQYFWHIIFYYFKRGKNTTEMQKKKKICAVYREGVVIDQMCQKGFVNFHAGEFFLDDAPQSGRPVEVDSNQIETLIENNQHYTTWEIVYILKISKPIKLLVKMKNVPFILQKKTNELFGQPNITQQLK